MTLSQREIPATCRSTHAAIPTASSSVMESSHGPSLSWWTMGRKAPDLNSACSSRAMSFSPVIKGGEEGGGAVTKGGEEGRGAVAKGGEEGGYLWSGG